MSENFENVEHAPGPVRVMHLVHSFGFGGMEVGVAKLANALDPALVSSSICSCRPSDSLKTRLRREVALFEFDRQPGTDVRFVYQLFRLLRLQQPHVLHTHGWATLCEGLLAGRLAGIPVIVHGEHGTLDTRRTNVVIQRWAWQRVNHLLAVSSRLRDRMADQMGFPAERIEVLRNGVDLNRFTPVLRDGARAALGLDSGNLTIGTAGRLVPVKDQATFLRALGLLNSRGHRFTALIAGTGPLADDLKGLASSLRLPDVHFLGNRPDIEHVLAAMDIFTLSSESEGLSNTIQEAMASGVAVVATRVGGADELVVHNRTGLLVPPKDPNAMADALEHLLLDGHTRRAMAAAARLRAVSEFGLDGMVQGYLRVYQHLTATVTRL